MKRDSIIYFVLFLIIMVLASCSPQRISIKWCQKKDSSKCCEEKISDQLIYKVKFVRPASKSKIIGYVVECYTNDLVPFSEICENISNKKICTDVMGHFEMGLDVDTCRFSISALDCIPRTTDTILLHRTGVYKIIFMTKYNQRLLYQKK